MTRPLLSAPIYPTAHVVFRFRSEDHAQTNGGAGPLGMRVVRERTRGAYGSQLFTGLRANAGVTDVPGIGAATAESRRNEPSPRLYAASQPPS